MVIYHLTQVRLAPSLVPHGYLAVDFFFILSGFVLARAYEQRLEAGMRIGKFFAARVFRLMPLSILGALAGFAVLLAKWTFFPEKVDELWQIVLSGVLNLLLLPTPFGGAASRQELFPGNGPLWSLFFEVVANVVWATLLFRWPTKRMAQVTLAMGACFAIAVASLGSANFGWDLHTAWFGLLRVLVGFTIGCLIHRYTPVAVGSGSRFATYFVALVLVALLSLPIQSDVYDAACALVVFPALVAFAARVDVLERSQQRLWAFLGDLSYPLYVLHFPVLLVASGLAQVLGPRLSPAVIAVGAFATSASLAWIALKVYDEPVRLRLTSLWRGERPRQARDSSIQHLEPAYLATTSSSGYSNTNSAE